MQRCPRALRRMERKASPFTSFEANGIPLQSRRRSVTYRSRTWSRIRAAAGQGNRRERHLFRADANFIEGHAGKAHLRHGIRLWLELVPIPLQVSGQPAPAPQTRTNAQLPSQCFCFDSSHPAFRNRNLPIRRSLFSRKGRRGRPRSLSGRRDADVLSLTARRPVRHSTPGTSSASGTVLVKERRQPAHITCLGRAAPFPGAKVQVTDRRART